MNKAMIESYFRNLLGAVLGAVTIVMGSTGIASPLDFGLGEWLLVANSLWASAVPTLLRWVNKKDPAFGLMAQVVATSVTTKLQTAAKEAVKAPVAPAPVAPVAAEAAKPAVAKAPAKKAPAKKADPKK